MSRAEIAWHMHHCGDSVSEGGKEGRKKEERDSERMRERIQEREGGEEGCITEIRSAPFSQTL